MSAAVVELLLAMLERNALTEADLISVLFTATPDLTCMFPAAAAREAGLADVPLICATEIDVDGALPRTVRILMHVETSRARADVTHVYLRGAEVLRQDLQR
jgi:chorismate mutase